MTPSSERSLWALTRLIVAWTIGLSGVVAPGRGHAITELETENSFHELIGSGRLTGAYLHFPDGAGLPAASDDAISAAVLRLILEGEVEDSFEYELNLFTTLTRSPSGSLQGAFATAGGSESVYRTRYLTIETWDSGSVEGRAGVDRMSVSWDLDPVAITVGRFPLNYSVTSMFTVNDFFAPFSATAINTIYKPGVDGARINLATGSMSSIELAGVVGNDNDDVPSWGRSALLIHARTVLWQFEWALVGGKLAKRWVGGGSLQGEAGPIAIRAEGHVGFPDENGDLRLDDRDGDTKSEDDIHYRASVGGDWMSSWRNLSIGVEYAFISDGAPSVDGYLNRIARLYPDDLPYLSQHYAGLNLGLDLVPILRLQTMGMINLVDFSGVAAASLVYNIADEADAVLGALVPWGEKGRIDSAATPPSIELGSELGDMPLVVFLETRFYF